MIGRKQMQVQIKKRENFFNIVYVSDLVRDLLGIVV